MGAAAEVEGSRKRGLRAVSMRSPVAREMVAVVHRIDPFIAAAGLAGGGQR